MYIRIHGLEYVSWPKLLSPNAPPPGVDVLYYDGPGFIEGRHGRGLSQDGLKLHSGRLAGAIQRKTLGTNALVDEKKRG